MGINNIPHKNCSYSCVYCQLGRTSWLGEGRHPFYSPEAIFEEVEEQVKKVTARGEKIDYLTFVPDGEPTQDLNLGKEIDLLRTLGINIAVITNASLLWREDVRKEVGKVDWVSVKVDSVNDEIWRKIDRPHGHLNLSEILDGILLFAKEFSGTLVTETMLVQGVNDDEPNSEKTAEFIARLNPSCAYLLIPTRPPAETGVAPPQEQTVVHIYQVFQDRLPNVECLIGYEGNAFSSTGQVETDLLNITAVHPMRKDAVALLLQQCGADWSLVENLIKRGELQTVQYRGKIFFVRKFCKRAS